MGYPSAAQVFVEAGVAADLPRVEASSDAAGVVVRIGVGKLDGGGAPVGSSARVAGSVNAAVHGDVPFILAFPIGDDRPQTQTG